VVVHPCQGTLENLGQGTLGNQGQGDLGESCTGGLEFFRYTGPFFLVIVDTAFSTRTAFLVSTGKIMILGRVSANVTTQHNTWDL
jgi:hypothetical protein